MDFGSFGKQYKGEDIISRMPDDVLSHIISRLQVKDAVKTCVLSSRFKNVWTLIYNLCFYRRTELLNFGELVLRRCQSNNIQKICLWTCDYLRKSDAARLSELICFAVERNVCSLTLKFNDEVEGPMIRLPQSILTCKSLVRLNLRFWDFALDIPDSMVCFPCLKFLNIFVECPNDNLMQKLFRCCPVLEELKIKVRQDMDGNVLTFDINVPTLKKLKIYLSVEDDYDISVHRFVVRARNLEYLNVDNDFLACFVLGETPFLNKVKLDSDFSRRLSFWTPKVEATKRSAEFFRAIGSTRFLSMGMMNFMSVLSPDIYGNLPSLPNLIYLHLGIDIHIGFALLVQFLNNLPNLEVLVLDKEDVFSYEKVREVRFELECVPSCTLLHLKEIYFFSVERKGQDLEVIKYLLQNSKFLERFSAHINIWQKEEDKQDKQNEILNFPRASPICKIDFLGAHYSGKLWSKFHCWGKLWSEFLSSFTKQA